MTPLTQYDSPVNDSFTLAIYDHDGMVDGNWYLVRRPVTRAIKQGQGSLS
jgi:hypothetical protein